MGRLPLWGTRRPTGIGLQRDKCGAFFMSLDGRQKKNREDGFYLRAIYFAGAGFLAYDKPEVDALQRTSTKSCSCTKVHPEVIGKTMHGDFHTHRASAWPPAFSRWVAIMAFSFDMALLSPGVIRPQQLGSHHGQTRRHPTKIPTVRKNFMKRHRWIWTASKNSARRQARGLCGWQRALQAREV